ncbi:MAG: hypothetical protein K9W44_11055 [Candidatus Lokiarchaeota archaeon]|nr:hypothetical protein [Candidatus Harpocratesius repetitus]
MNNSQEYIFSNSSSVYQEFEDVSKTTPAFTFFNNGLKKILTKSLQNFKYEKNNIAFDSTSKVSENIEKVASFLSKNKDKYFKNGRPGWLPKSFWNEKETEINSSDNQKNFEESDSRKDPP